MSDRELMQQALEALTAYDGTNGESKRKRVLAALRERLAQPNREWVGLTDDELGAMRQEAKLDFVTLREFRIVARAIEATLKERNG
jgi:hypothetical protein